MIDTPQVIQTSKQLSAFIRLTVTRDEMQQAFGPGITELMTTLAVQGIAPAGPVFAHHLRAPAETFDFELGVPVSLPVAATGRVQPGLWPVMKVAQTVYTGPYEGLPDAWGEFAGWIGISGHVPCEDLWECYVTGPHTSMDPTTWRTQLNRPLVC